MRVKVIDLCLNVRNPSDCTEVSGDFPMENSDLEDRSKFVMIVDFGVSFISSRVNVWGLEADEIGWFVSSLILGFASGVEDIFVFSWEVVAGDFCFESSQIGQARDTWSTPPANWLLCSMCACMSRLHLIRS